MSNIIDAIINLVHNPCMNLGKNTNNANRANSMGDALEEYIKDLFACAYNCATHEERNVKISETFSYLGNNSNPPDAMLKNGDAIEVKKIQTNNNEIALNSSYPKQFLFSDSPMISTACKEAEIWCKKDILYCIGVVKNDCLNHLAMVYGLDYCASSETYERIADILKSGINQIPNIEQEETRELGKLKKIDPLGITYLRIRGMWGIENPFKVFDYVFERDLTKKFNFMAIINDEKYKTLSNTNELELLAEKQPGLAIKDAKIKNPDNPAILKSVKVISFII